MTRCHPCMHLPTGALSSRPCHWGRKPAAPADCCQSGCHRFSLPDISEGGCPLCPRLSALVFSEWLHWLGRWLRIHSQQEWRRKGGFRNNVLKPTTAGQVSKWRFSKKIKKSIKLLFHNCIWNWSWNWSFFNTFSFTTFGWKLQNKSF